MSYSAQQVCDQLSDLVVSCENAEREFTDLSSLEDYQETSLTFISDEAQFKRLTEPLPAVIVTSPKIAEQLVQTHSNNNNLSVIAVQNVRLALALMKQHYDDYDASDSEWSAIHPSAVIHKSVQLGADVRVGPNSVIGKDAKIGSHTVIRANCVIEHDAQIGQSCVIHNLVNVGYECRLGDRVIIRPGTMIGNEGFGFAQDAEHRFHRIPHTGIVEIQDDVQIGANCNIDRGTYGKTVLSRGVKLDSLCHIAHNAFIDEDTVFAAQSVLAGSAHIGKRVMSSGQTGVLDHRSVCDDVTLLHRCGVTEDITEKGMWAGTPAKPFKEYVSNLDPYKKLKKLEKRIDLKIAELKSLLDKQ